MRRASGSYGSHPRPGACDPESACFLSLRRATGGHEEKSPGVEVTMEFSCRSRDSGDVLAS